MRQGKSGRLLALPQRSEYFVGPRTVACKELRRLASPLTGRHAIRENWTPRSLKKSGTSASSAAASDIAVDHGDLAILGHDQC
jgi:hypothetical protein